MTPLSHPVDRARARAPDFEPAYRRLLATGALAERVTRAGHHMRACDLCARYCRIDRTRTIRGAACRTGTRPVNWMRKRCHDALSILISGFTMQSIG